MSSQCETTAGSVNDNHGGSLVMDQIIQNHPNTKTAVMDAGYTSPVLIESAPEPRHRSGRTL
ncbi:MAG: transposase [Bacillus subtilis]|nr:transposase [Bacillus subtilis]